MTDYIYTAKGIGVFIIGVILSYVLGFLIPAIVSSATGVAAAGQIEEYGQYAMILIWVLGIIILPNYFFYQGINTESDRPPFIDVIISILMLLFTFLFLYKAYFVITGLANIIEGGLLLGIYWIGVVSVVGFGFIVTPIATIIQAMHKNQ